MARPSKPSTRTADRNKDTDRDGLTDREERTFRSDPTLADTDGDGLSDAREKSLGTKPKARDSDKDGVSDGDEVRLGTDPRRKPSNDPSERSDMDGDGVSDAEEKRQKTNPMETDTDGDGIEDGLELRLNSNPTNANSVTSKVHDIDGDGLSNFDEIAFGTNPAEWDSDGDGRGDGAERMHGLDPLNKKDDFGKYDSDGDGFSDEVERKVGTSYANPNDRPQARVPAAPPPSPFDSGDSDADGLSNTAELIHHTKDDVADSDGDLIDDGMEVRGGSDPNVRSSRLTKPWKDRDRDGLNDDAEDLLGTLSGDSDSDDDGIPDGQEVAHGSNPLKADHDWSNWDSDGDGFSDKVEYQHGTNGADNRSHPGVPYLQVQPGAPSGPVTAAVQPVPTTHDTDVESFAAADEPTASATTAFATNDFATNEVVIDGLSTDDLDGGLGDVVADFGDAVESADMPDLIELEVNADGDYFA